MSFKSFLSAVGHFAGDVFSWLGSAKGQATIVGVETGANLVAGAFNPALAVALPAVETLINNGIKEAVTIETVAVAAGQQGGTGAQKGAAFVAKVEANVGAFLQSIGISTPTAEQVQTLSTALGNGVVAILNAIPAPPSTAK